MITDTDRLNFLEQIGVDLIYSNWIENGENRECWDIIALNNIQYQGKNGQSLREVIDFCMLKNQNEKV
jgi:hypothetical protein